MARPFVSDFVSGQNSTTLHREKLASSRNQIRGQKETGKLKGEQPEAGKAGKGTINGGRHAASLRGSRNSRVGGSPRCIWTTSGHGKEARPETVTQETC